MVHTAFVHLWNKKVGAIAWNADTGLASFEFEPSYLSQGWNVSPLMMPLSKSKGRVFSFPELRNNITFKGLPGLLADALPDRYGNTLINTWLARHGRTANSLNPVELLCFIGKRGMGALEFEPSGPKQDLKANPIELDGLIQIAQQIISGKKNFRRNLNEKEETALVDILKIGTSAGGARAKAVITYNPISREVCSGQTSAPEGFSHWLMKFDGVNDYQVGGSMGFGRVEMAYHLMAKDCNINMSPCMLLEENARAHFMTQRFDRYGANEKIHIQTFCAMAHLDYNNVSLYSYEQLFETMRQLLLPYDDAEQLYRRMVFNVLGRNCDDHTKNFAFTMNKNNEWRLAPAYDVCHAYRPDSTWVSQHSMSINGKRSNISRNDLLTVARNMNIKKAESILDQINEVINNWKVYAAKTHVPTGLKKTIEKTLLHV